MEGYDIESYKNLCRVCGEEIEEGSRTVKKEKVSNVMKSLYDVTVSHDVRWLPSLVHYKCKCRMEYANTAHKEPPNLKTFPPPTEKQKVQKRKSLMDLTKKQNANKRIKSFENQVDKFCTDEGEDKEDVLKYLLKKELYRKGKRKEAQQLKSSSTPTNLPPPKLLHPSPLTPKTTLARVVVSKRSFNQYEDDFRFLKQKKKQVFSGPTATFEEKWKINQKAVEFTLIDKATGRSLHYEPPQPPVKPVSSSYETKDEKKQAWKDYKRELSSYRKKLQPNHLQSDHTLPEEIQSQHMGMLFFHWHIASALTEGSLKNTLLLPSIPLLFNTG